MIEFNDISFTYNGRRTDTGVNHISFCIEKGETVLICGGSGCGKSTVTRIINGLIPHFYKGALEGEFKIDSQRMNDKTLYEINDKTGSVFQNPRTQFFNLDTDSELVFGCENRGYPLESILENREKSIADFGLKPLMNRNIYKLSGGQQQKIACASTYCTNPDIFVLDEPTSNLDEESIDELKAQLNTIKKQGKTIVIAEHRLYFLIDLIDRVFYMENGKLAHIYTNDEFKNLSEQELNRMGLRTTKKPSMNQNLLYKTDKKYDNHLKIHHAKVTYSDDTNKKKQVVSVQNLSIPLGEIVAIVGKNGIGKTTLAKVITGLQKKAKAEIYLKGKKLTTKERIRNCFFVMQDVNHQLFTESVIKEIKLGAKNLSEDQVAMLMEKLALSELKLEHPMNISGGQKQRVVIAAAISSGKKIVVLDEPTSGLDFTQMQNVSSALKNLQVQVDLILVITHDIEFVNSCCTLAIQMND